MKPIHFTAPPPPPKHGGAPDGWFINLISTVINRREKGEYETYPLETGLQRIFAEFHKELRAANDARERAEHQIAVRRQIMSEQIAVNKMQRITIDELQAECRALVAAAHEAQCCMCGKKGLSTAEDGGPECQLTDGRWTCSAACYCQATGDDTLPASPARDDKLSFTPEMRSLYNESAPRGPEDFESLLQQSERLFSKITDHLRKGFRR